MAFAISNDPDTLTYRHREAMAAPDKEQFIQSMVKEVQGQLDLKMLHHVPRSKAPPTAPVLPAVWTFCCKRRQTMGKILKIKGRLNIGGHRMREDINHDLTYSPTAFGLLFALPLAWFSHMDGTPNKLTMCKLTLKLLLPDLCTWKSQKIVKSLVTIPKIGHHMFPRTFMVVRTLIEFGTSTLEHSSNPLDSKCPSSKDMPRMPFAH